MWGISKLETYNRGCHIWKSIQTNYCEKCIIELIAINYRYYFTDGGTNWVGLLSNNAWLNQWREYSFHVSLPICLLSRTYILFLNKNLKKAPYLYTWIDIKLIKITLRCVCSPRNRLLMTWLSLRDFSILIADRLQPCHLVWISANALNLWPKMQPRKLASCKALLFTLGRRSRYLFEALSRNERLDSLQILYPLFISLLLHFSLFLECVPNSNST